MTKEDAAKKGVDYINNYLLEDETYVGPAKTERGYVIYDANFPLLYQEGDDSVEGELYLVGDSCLHNLDILENHPNLYRREIIKLDDGSEVYAYIWPYGVIGAKKVGKCWKNPDYLVNRNKHDYSRKI